MALLGCLVLAAPAFAGHAKTERVSVSSAGVQGDGHSFSPSISADGRYVAFRSHATDLVVSDTNGVADTFVRDRTTDRTTPEPNECSCMPSSPTERPQGGGMSQISRSKVDR